MTPILILSLMCFGLGAFMVALLRTSKQSELVMEEVTRAEAYRQLLAKHDQQIEFLDPGWEDAK